MAPVNSNFSVQKTNLYRAGVGQPLARRERREQQPGEYCPNMVNIQTPFLAGNKAMRRPHVAGGRAREQPPHVHGGPADRSFTNLNCQNFGLTNPVTLTIDGNGVATAATFNTTAQQAANQGRAGMPRPGLRMGRGHHRLMDPSGM